MLLLSFAAVLMLLGLRGDARANAPAGRYTDATNTLCSGTPCVLDNQTGLVWLQSELGGGPFNWSSAQTACASPWRLPNVRELQSIVDETQTTAPAIDMTVFSSTGGFVWSSSAGHQGVPGLAWFVDFGKGTAGATTPSSAYGVRCVR